MDQSSRPTYMEASAPKAIDAVQSFIHKCNAIEQQVPSHQRLIEPVLTPRFVPTCSDELLSGLGQLSASHDLLVQSHMAESHDQVEWVRQQRKMEDIDVFDKARQILNRSCFPVNLLSSQHGLLTNRTIQAHCTFLDQPMLNRVAVRGTAIAHCPLSNAYFSAELFPLREALRDGVRVGLGTDIAGGYDINIMSAMRHAVTVSRMREGGRIMADSRGKSKPALEDSTSTGPLSINWKEALYLATRGGAEALRLKSGVLRVGAPFDAHQSECILALE